MKAVCRLLPVGGVTNQLHDGLDRSNPHQQPVRGNQQRGNQQIGTFHHTGHVQAHVHDEEVSHHHTHQPQVVDPGREQPGHDRGLGCEPDQGEDPEHTVEGAEQGGSGDEDDHVRHGPPSELSGDQARRTHVHQEGLQITLVPTAPLPNPVDQVRVGLLQSRGIEHTDPVSSPV